MKSLFNIKNERLKMLFTVLFFGGLWGFIEATLGFVLKLGSVKSIGVFVSSTAILLPLAFYLMGLCYKKTGTLRSIVYMGLIAAAIKFSTITIFGFIDIVYNPSIYIVIESLTMVGAIALIRPKNILSAKSFLTASIAATSYIFLMLVCKQLIDGEAIFTDMASWTKASEKYLLIRNMTMHINLIISGSIIYGLSKIIQKFNWKLNTELANKILYNPITASAVFAVAVVTTFLL